MYRGDIRPSETEAIIGDGCSTMFWTDHWIDGMAIEVLAPSLFAAVPNHFKSCSVHYGLCENNWVADIRGVLDVQGVAKHVDIWERIQSISLRPEVEDEFLCRWTPDFNYSSAETMNHLLIGCSFSRQVWFLTQPSIHGVVARLLSARHSFDALILLVSWSIWKERNDRTFRRRASMPWVVVSRVVCEAELWVSMGFSALAILASQWLQGQMEGFPVAILSPNVIV
ncbi:hypothetical protein BS78_05G202800 [Paspalum vaginatum]|nr:hypothetical protein BS78_05G202800 [Paspalum vaginatum]